MKNIISKKVIIRVVLVVLILINCTVIFNFSSDQSEESNKKSGVVVERIVEINPKTKNLSKQEKEKKKEQIVTPIRKTAHFTVYTCLGVLLFLCAKTFDGKEKNKILVSVGLAFLYACSDEIHQHFVPGRSCELRDVCIDTCGALFGIIMVYFIARTMKKVKIKVQK